MSKEQQTVKLLLKSLCERPVAYHRIFARITGSVTAGLLLSQIVYWWGAMEEKEFWKTDKDLTEELTMGQKELKNAKAKLKKLGIIRTVLKGVPCRTFYRLEESTLLAQISSMAEKANLDKPKGPNLIGRNGPAITKTNPREFAEITKQEKKKISPEKVLALDSMINEERKKFMIAIAKILHPGAREATTFARITKHLVALCQAGKAGPTIFQDAISWAKGAKRVGKKPKALFVAMVKQKTGFKAQSQLLRKNQLFSSPNPTYIRDFQRIINDSPNLET